MKKLASLILALAMCFALGVPAFATETGNMDTEMVSVLPELQITLPDSASIILNPYRMTTTETGTGITSGDRFQIMNPVFSVVSDTTSMVHVKATITGSVSGNAEFASAPVAPYSAGHSVYLQLWYAKATENTAAVPLPDDPTSPTNVVAVKDEELVMEWDLDAKSTANNSKSQRIDMQFSGTCSDSPTEEEGPWTESDTVSASFVFEVNPVTDNPMITASYQNKSTPVDFTFPTTKPVDSKNFKVKALKIGTTTITPDDISGTQTDTKWDGSKVTITPTKLGTTLNATTKPVYVTAVVELQWENSKKAGDFHSVTYTVKVLCFPSVGT